MKLKKVTSMFLALLVVVTMIPMNVFAVESDTIKPGTVTDANLTWGRTPDDKYSAPSGIIYTEVNHYNDVRNHGINRNAIEKNSFTWADVKNLSYSQTSNVWDRGAYYDLTSGNKPSHNYASWKRFSTGKYKKEWFDWEYKDEYTNTDIRRFRATFEVPQGYSATDSVRISSVAQSRYSGINGGNIVPINDNIYIFLYKEGEDIDNNNCMKYLSFWTGTSNQSGIVSYRGRKGTLARQTMNRNLSHTDGWYANADINNIGESLFVNYPDAKAGDSFTIDVFVEDYNGGGAMDQLQVQFIKSQSVSSTVNVEYYDKNTKNKIEDSLTGETVSGTVLTEDSLVRTESGAVPVKKLITGWKYDSKDPVDGVLVKANGQNTLKLYYKKDTSATLPYTVRYYFDGEHQEELDYNSTVPYHTPTVDTNGVPDNKPAGYKLDEKSTKLPFTVTSSDNVIKVYYAKDDSLKLNYTVEYYKGDETTPFESNNKLTVPMHTPAVGSVSYANKPAGYKLDEQKSTKLPFTVTSSDNVIKVYYAKDDSLKLNYTVEYYKDNETTPFESNNKLTVPMHTPAVGSVSYANKPAGYKLDEEKSTELPFTVTSSNNVIKVYYVKDDSQKLNYTVEYYKGDETTPFESNNNLTVPMHTPVVNSVSYANRPVGYKLDEKSTKLPFTVTSSDNIIKVYYAKDDSQKLNYTVEYYKGDETTPFESNNNLTVPMHTPVVNSVSYANKPVGYKLDEKSTKLPFTVTSSDNVIKVYYAKDDSQKLNYTVEYYKDNAATSFYKDNLTVPLHTPVVNSVSYANKPAGYKLDEEKSTELPFTVTSSNNVIKVYYAKDDSQKLNYTVEYYKGDETTPFESNNKLTVPLHTPVVNSVSYANKPAGYKLDEEKSTELPFTVTSSNNVIKVYYAKDDSQKLNYTVEYYKDNAATSFYKDNLTVPMHTPVVNSVSYANKPAGYKLDEEKSTKLPFTVTSSNNVIKVYYAKDDSLKLNYTVEYYKDNAATSFYKDNLTVPMHTPVVNSVSYANKPAGYKLDEEKSTKLPFTVTSSDNVIKVYYAKDDSQKLNYTVEYYKDNAATSFYKDNLTVPMHTPVVNSVSYANKPAGYKLDEEKSTELPFTVTSSDNVIKVYYVKDDNLKLNYTVEYYKDNETTSFYKDNLTVPMHTPVVNSVSYANKPAGYKLDEKSTKLPFTVTSSDNVIKVYYVKDDSQKLNYTVEYYKDNETTSFYKDNLTVPMHTPVVNSVSYANKPAGYKLDEKSTKLPFTVTSSNNVIKVYYAKDDNLKLNYAVEYYKGDETTPFESNNKLTVPMHTPVVNSVSYANKPAGYKLDEKSTELPFTVTSSDNVIKVYYAKDDSQKLNYTVEYYKGDETTPFESNNKLTVPMHTPVVNSVSYANKPAGYKLDEEKSTELPFTVTSSNNVIKVYYAGDYTQTKELSYTVEYYKDDAKVDTLTETQTVWINAGNTIDVKPVDTSNDKYTGYKFEKTNPETLPETIANGSVIQVYYVKDDAQTLPYTVEYYKDEETAPFESNDKLTVPMHTPTVNSVVYANKPAGYKLDEEKSTKLPFTVTSANKVIKVYYIKDDTQKLSYSIEYYYDEESEPFETSENTVLKSNPIVEFVPDAESLKKGFTRDRIEPDLPFEISEEKNVIKVYYKEIPDGSVSIPVTHEYFTNGDKDGVQNSAEVALTIPSDGSEFKVELAKMFAERMQSFNGRSYSFSKIEVRGTLKEKPINSLLDESKTEEPKVEEPKPEVPVTEEPKVEEPKPEVPVTEEPKVEEPKPEVPVTEEPKAEEPKPEVPVTEEPKTEEPKPEVPVTEEPKAEEPKPEVPVTEEPKAEEPKSDEQNVSQPVIAKTASRSRAVVVMQLSTIDGIAAQLEALAQQAAAAEKQDAALNEVPSVAQAGDKIETPAPSNAESKSVEPATGTDVVITEETLSDTETQVQPKAAEVTITKPKTVLYTDDFVYDPDYDYEVIITYKRTTGGGGGGGNKDRGNNNNDDDDNTVIIENPAVPLAPLPDGLVTIVDPKLPLGNLPKFGGSSRVLAVFGCLAIVGSLALKLKKDDEDSDEK